MSGDLDSTNLARSKKNQKDLAQRGYDLVDDVDWIAVSGGIIVIVSAMVMYNQTTHTMPQTSTTFTVRPVVDLALLRGSKSGDLFKSKASFEGSAFYQTSRMQAFGALKFTLGCYGRNDAVLSEVAATAWAQLSERELQAGPSSVSVCTCVDEHVMRAFAGTLFLGAKIDDLAAQFSAGAGDHALYDDFPLVYMHKHQGNLPRMHGNVPVRLTDDVQFERLAGIRDWCAQAAAPVYTLHVASVWNSRLLLLLGVSLMVIGLDLFSTRRLTDSNPYILK